MFTGIVTHIGRVVGVADSSVRTFEVEPGFDASRVPVGASVSHSGICLTVVSRTTTRWRVQAVPETLARTTAGAWRPGTRLNIERSLRVGDELGGHLVFGHVDAVGEIRTIEPLGDSRRVEIAMPPALAPLLAVKGSVAVDGISLTVAEAAADRFAVAIIPHTWAHTTLQDRRVGDAVNLEVDMLARYVARQIAFARSGAGDA